MLLYQSQFLAFRQGDINVFGKFCENSWKDGSLTSLVILGVAVLNLTQVDKGAVDGVLLGCHHSHELRNLLLEFVRIQLVLAEFLF